MKENGNKTTEQNEEEIDNINHIDPRLSDIKTYEIKTINKERLDFFVDENKPPERRWFIHYKSRPEQWIIDTLERRK